MRISALALQHVRSHEQYVLDLQDTSLLLIGKNGTGKTSLLEAIYIALRGGSFRGNDTAVLMHGSPWYRIDVRSLHHQRTVTFDPSRTSGRKQFRIDSQTYYRLPEAHKYPVVLFEPDDLQLLSGSPSRRRRWLDRFIMQYRPQHGRSLRQYEQALRQRNNALKQQLRGDALFVWDVLLARYGADIAQARAQAVSYMAERITGSYQQVSDAADAVWLSYEQAAGGSTQQELLDALGASRQKDMAIGFTTVGPHRDDMQVTFNGAPALDIASRGEVRSIILAMKLLEIAAIAQLSEKQPVVLLDDVFSELDDDRQRRLVGLTDATMIITSNRAPEGYSGQLVTL